MKDEMTVLVLFLFLLHQLNKSAVGVQIIKSDDSDVSMINNAVYKVLQACSKNSVHRVSVIQRSNPIIPFVPYKWNLSNTAVIYDYNAEKLYQDIKANPLNFQIIIIYDYRDIEGITENWLSKLTKFLSRDRFVKFIAVSFNSQSWRTHQTAHTIAQLLRRDYVIHIFKNKLPQRVDIWTINLFLDPKRLRWTTGANQTIKVMSVSGDMDEQIDTCDSVFYPQEYVIRRNGRYIYHTHGTHSVFLKLYPPLMTYLNDSPRKVVRVDKPEKCEWGTWKRQWRIYGGYDGKVMATIFPKLDIRGFVHRIREPNEDSSTLIDWNVMIGHIRHYESIVLNSYDWMFIPFNEVSFTYPRVQREIRVITQSRGIVSMPVRIREIFNYKILVSAIIISGLFILAQRYVDDRSFGNAALDAYCLILGLGVPKLPNTLASRIFFSSLIFYFIILCTHFQGNVTQIMTVPLVAVNVDSLEDLDASGYTVYAARSTYEDFEWFRKRFKNFVEHAGDHCIDFVLGDNLNTACIDEAEYLQHEILKHNNLHLVKEPIRRFYSTYLVNKNWDYKYRFEILFARLSQSGILYKWQKDIENLSKIKAQIWELRENHHDARMSLENWKIFFILLYAGLFVATIVWIVEILYARKNLAQSLLNVCIYFLLRIYFLFRQGLAVFYLFKQHKFTFVNSRK